MLPNRDKLSQPSKGRFFAYPAAYFYGTIRNFSHDDDFHRIDLHMINPTGQADSGECLAALHPQEAVVVYSHSIDMPLLRARALLDAALESLLSMSAEVRPPFHSPHHAKRLSFRTYLAENNEVVLTRQEVAVARARYVGTDKFSNSFKMKKSTVAETVLRRWTI